MRSRPRDLFSRKHQQKVSPHSLRTRRLWRRHVGQASRGPRRVNRGLGLAVLTFNVALLSHAIILHDSLHSSCCSVTQTPSLSPHSHRHWPICLPQSLPLQSLCRSRPLQAQKQPRSPRSRPPRAISTMISSGPTPRSRMPPDDRRLSGHTQRYISLEERRRKSRHLRTSPNTRSLHSFTGPETLRP